MSEVRGLEDPGAAEELSLEWFQQGDVKFHRVAALPEGLVEVARRERGLVIADGEVTGHAHVVETSGARLYSLDEILYLMVEEPVDCVHEEHDTVRLPEGLYRIGGVRETDYTAIEEEERKERLAPQGRAAAAPRRTAPRRTGRNTIDRVLEDRRAADQRSRQQESEARSWRRVLD